ncbi:MAG: hypothetical protein U1E02_29120, partial [Hydrogenophaga sp.]|nr:hypothetical protein [Hydrogenophaga sp.]
MIEAFGSHADYGGKKAGNGDTPTKGYFFVFHSSSFWLMGVYKKRGAETLNPSSQVIFDCFFIFLLVYQLLFLDVHILWQLLV